MQELGADCYNLGVTDTKNARETRTSQAEPGPGLIVYSSRYGSTQKYARWLQERTAYDLVRVKDATRSTVDAYSSIVLMGPVHAGGIGGLKWLVDNFERLDVRNATMSVFAVGASPQDATTIDALREHNLTEEMTRVSLFYGRGALDLAHMNFWDRNLCSLLLKAVKRKDPAKYEPWEAALMATGSGHQDWTDPAYLEPLVAFLREEGAVPAS